MPIQKLTTNYTGREKDINIFPTVRPTVKGPQPTPGSFGKVSSYCAGIQKLAQRYLIALLTIRGSQPNFPNFGTNLLKQVNTGSVTTNGDLVHIFNFANVSVISAFRSAQEKAKNIPMDEQLDTVVLNSVSVTVGNSVNYNISLYTNAGQTYDYVLPIPIQK